MLHKHFMSVVKNDPLLKTFPRKDRMIFADRMTDMEKARLEESPCELVFPPEGYEIKFFPKASHLHQTSLSDGKDVPAL